MTGMQALGMVLAYLIGGVPIGLLAGLARGVDVRKTGSGNIGATNVMRAVGSRIGLAVFVADVGKGSAGVLLGATLGLEGWRLGMAAMFVVMGHCYSPYLALKGGKGVATTLGAFLALRPVPALLCLGVWILVVVVTRFVSLGSILAVAVAPVVIYLSAPASDADLALILLAIAILVIGRHSDNLERLLKGTEPRVGGKRPKPERISAGAEADE